MNCTICREPVTRSLGQHMSERHGQPEPPARCLAGPYSVTGHNDCPPGAPCKPARIRNEGIRTDRGETGTFRVYEGGTFIGYVLTVAKPGDGPHWARPLGRQGRTASGTVAEWAPSGDEAIALLVAAYRAEGTANRS